LDTEDVLTEEWEERGVRVPVLTAEWWGVTGPVE